MEIRYRPGDTGYYEQLETGARWLAARADEGSERDTHLGHAERYARLRLDAVVAGTN